MPNWKKVITSGSDAAFNTVIASNGFTGSLQGTGSWALNAVTASYITGSVFTSANPALSASFATTASHALNVSPPVTINNNTDNFIVTATGTSATVQGEPNFRFDGSLLQLTGSAIISGANASLIVSGTVSATNGFTGNLTGTSSWSEVSRRIRVGVAGTLLNPPDDDYYVLMMRESLVGSNETTVLTTTSSMIYSASLGLLYVTASWAYTASQAISASYAANAAPTVAEGNVNEIQYNADGTNFGGVPVLTYDGSTLVGTGKFDGNLRLGLYRGAQTNITVASDAEEVLIYTHYIPQGTFTDNDVIRVRWRTYNESKNSPEYYIYMADTSDFNTVSGSSSNIIAFCTASNNTISYLQMKRDFSLNANDGTLDYITANLPLITDDTLLVNATPIKTFAMDWANTDYWMFFSAKPNDANSSCQSKYCTVERV